MFIVDARHDHGVRKKDRQTLVRGVMIPLHKVPPKIMRGESQVNRLTSTARITSTHRNASNVIVFVFLIAVLALSVSLAAIPAKDNWAEAPVIDMHTHVFNARDLPLI